MLPAKKIVQNSFKRRLAAGEPSLLFTIRLARTTEIVGIAAGSGHDAFYIDLQHNTLSVEAAAQLCQAGLSMGLTPLVRVPSIEPGLIGRLLDHGAQGIIAPDVRTAEDAAAIVACCRFPPKGERSYGGAGPHSGYRPVAIGDAQRELDEETLVICMIESRPALDQVAAIAALEGVDALFVGTNDLTSSMGIPGELRHPDVADAYRLAIEASRGHGKPLMVGGVRDPQLVAQFVSMGAAPVYFTGNDTAFLLDGATRQAAAFRSVIAS